MSITGTQGKRPEETCSTSLTQELGARYRVLPQVIYQTIKSNSMQSRNEGGKEGIWQRQGNHGCGERHDVSMYEEGKYFACTKLL